MSGIENQFIDGLIDLLVGTEVVLYDGTIEYINEVHMPKLPHQVAGNTHFILVPLGPQFDLSILGQGANMRARSKRVAVILFILHDGVDETLVVRNLSELTQAVAEKVMDNIKNRIGGADMVDLVDCDYDWATTEDQDDNSLTVTSTSSILITATYGRT